MNVKVLVVGTDFRFGRKAIGDIRLLIENQTDNFKVIPIDLLCVTGKKISSSDIKTLLKEHRLEEAESLLSYYFFINGKVIKGLQNGRKIGFPTANMIYPSDKVKLPTGVYKTKVAIDGKEYLGMTNIGNHPTVDALKEDIIETHILDFSQDIYGKEIKVSFLKYLRPQTKFSSLHELKAQLIKDLEQIKK